MVDCCWEGGIVNTACYIFQDHISYSFCKTVSVIRKYFSFNTVLRIGKTFIFIFSKIKMLHWYFPPLSTQIPAFSYWCLQAGQSALNEGVALLLSSYRLYLCIQILAFSRKVCQFRSKTGRNFSQVAVCDLDRF